MTPGPEEVEALAQAIDRLVFPELRRQGAPAAQPSAALELVSYLNDSFPRVTLPIARRERVQRQLIRALRIPAGATPRGWERLEWAMNRRIPLDSPWTPVVGGAALVIIGVLGVAYWRQRSALKAVAANLS
jgi:hypothetical protein